MKNISIDEIMNMLYEKYQKSMSEKSHQKESGWRPQFCIYVDINTFHELKKSVVGEVSRAIFEFYQTDKIDGTEVFKVLTLDDKFHLNIVEIE